MYYGIVTKLQNCHKAPNSDRLFVAKCYGEQILVSEDMKEGDTVLYLPEGGQIERWFGNPLKLFDKNEDGTSQGGYTGNNGHVKAIKLRGNKSYGIAVPIKSVYEHFGDQKWEDGDKVTLINKKEFCRKFFPPQKEMNSQTKTSYKGKKTAGIIYPYFEMHKDTEQLAYNLDEFKPRDIINITLKIHGTSTRHMRTIAALPRNFWRKLFHMKPKIKSTYVCGTRKCVVSENHQGYYGNDEFRIKYHKALEPYIEDKMCVYGEIAGYYGPNETDTIMPSCNNSLVKDKNFEKEFGKVTKFTYGCEPGENRLFIYRITSENGEKEWSPQEITDWCNKNGFDRVPIVDDFVFTTKEDLMERIDKYFEDLHDPIDPRHIKEGVVVRKVGDKWQAYKQKTFEFKVLSNLITDNIDTTNMSEDIISEM